MSVGASLSMRWAALSQRERVLLALGTVVLGMALLFLGVWKPLATLKADDLARIARTEKMLLAFSQMPDGAVPSGDARPIAAIIAQTAAAQGLTILRLETPRPDAATVSLQDVPFKTLILWIDGLGRDSGLTVASALIRQADNPGLVTADLSLQRGVP